MTKAFESRDESRRKMVGVTRDLDAAKASLANVHRLGLFEHAELSKTPDLMSQIDRMRKYVCDEWADLL